MHGQWKYKYKIVRNIIVHFISKLNFIYFSVALFSYSPRDKVFHDHYTGVDVLPGYIYIPISFIFILYAPDIDNACFSRRHIIKEIPQQSLYSLFQNCNTVWSVSVRTTILINRLISDTVTPASTCTQLLTHLQMISLTSGYPFIFFSFFQCQVI